MKSKISVIIPTYMEEKYIEDTLKSVKNQTRKAQEIIVCDSSSRDKTVKIARKYADKVIVIKERGVSVGRNRGAKAATGNIFLFLDADTILMPDFIEKISNAFEERNLVAASGYAKTYGRKRDRLIYFAMNEIIQFLTVLGMPAFYGTCVAIRKSVFEKLGGFDTGRMTSEDWDLAIRASKIGECGLIREAVALTSPRRIGLGGYFRLIFFHIRNFFRYVIFRTGSKNYPPLR